MLSASLNKTFPSFLPIRSFCMISVHLHIDHPFSHGSCVHTSIFISIHPYIHSAIHIKIHSYIDVFIHPSLNKAFPFLPFLPTQIAIGSPGWARPAGCRSRWWRSASVWSGWSCSAWSDWSSLRRPSRSPATAGQRPAAAGLEPPPTCLQTEWRPARLSKRKQRIC